MPGITLEDVINRLQSHYGLPAPHPVTDPWLMILWENVAYLADDARRLAAFNALRKSIGTTPKAILAASKQKLEAVTGYGILAPQFAEKLRECARIAIASFPHGLGDVVKLPIKQACNALMKFPGIGKPGAEKILLFAQAHAVFALESNGLRVLVRLGVAPDQGNYAATYRQIQDATANQIKVDFTWLMTAHDLLRKHGQELCRRSSPRCDQCPLLAGCDRVGVNT